MDIERAMETQRLRLLRLVTGWLVAVAFVLARPFFHAGLLWVSDGVSSILSRAEAAAQCLVIVQARIIAARTGSDIDPERLLDFRTRESVESEATVSLGDLRKRLEALRALLEDLPRYGLRLLRRTEKRVRRLMRSSRSHYIAPCRDTPVALCVWRLAGVRVERPPDKRSWHLVA